MSFIKRISEHFHFISYLKILIIITILLFPFFQHLKLESYQKQVIADSIDENCYYFKNQEHQFVFDRHSIITNENLSEESKTIEILSNIPEDLIIPGEFEEVQAILISWPCHAFDSSDRLLIPFTKGFGIEYIGDTFKLVPIAYYKINLVNESPFVKIFEQLTNEIQKECPIWIRLPQASDSFLLKQWFYEKGNPLYNYKFIISEEGANSIWMRDCGPIAGYYSNMDSIALLNFEYYPNAPIDNDLPFLISNYTGYKVITSNLELEGGNFLTDGYKNFLTSTLIYESNSDTIGTTYTKKNPLSNIEIENELKSMINNNSLTILQKLTCDGGTGHLDFYIKFINENTFLINSYPKVYDNPNFPDYNILINNKKVLDTLKSVYNENYNIIEIETPPSDDGYYNNTDCQSFSLNPRTYANSLFVNKMLLFPKYSNDFDGFSPADEIAEAIYKDILPGYRIVGIDCRAMIRSGGALHCLALQVPTENPIRILHKPINKSIPLSYEIPISAYVQSNIPIASVNCYWRKKSQNFWSKIKLNFDDQQFKGVIKLDDLTSTDTIQYYIEAINANEKKGLKPITAPNGYFYITFESNEPIQSVYAKLFPNPINDNTVIFLKLNKPETVKIEIYDCLGKLIRSVFNGSLYRGEFIKQLNFLEFGIGIYYMKICIGQDQKMLPFLKLN